MISKRSVRAAIQSIILVLVPVWAFAQKVNYDFDKTKNFTHVKSFVLKGVEKSDNPLVDQRISAAIVSQLSARGMRLVDRDPDVVVVPSLTSETKQEVTAYNTGYGPYGPYYGGWGWGYGSGWGWGYGGGWGATTYEVREKQYDTLVIDMVDVETGSLIWRGKGVTRVHDHWRPDDVDKNVNKTVNKILNKLPPVD